MLSVKINAIVNDRRLLSPRSGCVKLCARGDDFNTAKGKSSSTNTEWSETRWRNIITNIEKRMNDVGLSDCLNDLESDNKLSLYGCY